MLENKSNQIFGQSQNEVEFARDIFESGQEVQFMGVTATLIGFSLFLFSQRNYFGEMESRIVPTLKVGWPLIVAYLALGVSIFVRKRFSTPHKALLWIYVAFISSDVVLLGVLVWLTGGPNRSVFAPVFLLIPSITACYCHYKSNFFHFLIGIIIVILGAASLLQFKGLAPTFGEQVSENSTSIELLLTNVFTIGCVCTAVRCYKRTQTIRNEYCGLRKEGDSRPNICRKLYL
ncbi:MAG: hypothetical protein ACYS3N_10505 [Planctomycetota bacterium]|jgi:hypothetical protein